MKNSKAGMFAILFTSIMFLVVQLESCKDKTDVQAPKKEIILTENHDADTVVVVLADTIGGNIILDSFISVQPGKPEALLSDIKEFESDIIIVYTPPTDSLVDAVYMSQVGVREATGKNDGKDVEKYLKSVGLGKGHAWCAAFVKWCFDQAHVKTNITGWSPTAHNKKNIVFINAQFKKEIQKGDVFTIYFPKMKRIGHTGFVRRKFGFNSIETVEGNTNGQGAREGDGVYVKIRPKSTIHGISRWF